MKTPTIDQSRFLEWCRASFSETEDRLNGGRALPFHERRTEAMTRFEALGLPTTRDEEWKYTNLAAVFHQEYTMTPEPAQLTQGDLAQWQFEGLEERTIVFVNGRYSESLSTFNSNDDGLSVTRLAEAFQNGSPEVQKHLGRHAGFESQPLVALNTAFAFDGLCLHVGERAEIVAPVQLLHITVPGSTPHVTMPRLLVVMEPASRLKLVESYHATAEGVYFNNAVSEHVLAAGAQLEAIKIQKESRNAFHVAASQAVQDRDSVFTNVDIDLGGALVRNDVNVLLDAPNAECHLYGFFLGTEKRLVDSHTLIDHAKPNCESNELYKGILDDRARGVFNGKVMVRPDAQKTNAYQDNKCLLLTDDAVMNAKPQLEIFADDVKCSHGATVGQLEEQALFYLRSRGIGEENANSLLRYAFASDVFEKISVDAVKDRLESEIFRHFGNE